MEKKSKNEVAFKREESIMGSVNLIGETSARVFTGNITMCWLWIFVTQVFGFWLSGFLWVSLPNSK